MPLWVIYHIKVPAARSRVVNRSTSFFNRQRPARGRGNGRYQPAADDKSHISSSSAAGLTQDQAELDEGKQTL